jgi:8-oxo-dGTP diphosphatase
VFSIGVFVTIFDEQRRVLLCHRRDLDVWNLPGGGLERGELPVETAVRETREETGLEIAVERLVGVYAKTYKDELVFVFSGKIVGGELATTDEADQCLYFEVKDLPANTIPKHVARIHDALNLDSQPIFRHESSPATRELFRQVRES